MILINPVLQRDLVAVLESRKTYFFTALYLFGSAAIVYWGWPEGDRILQGSEVSRHLFQTFCLTQLAVLGVMIPALSAPVLTQEKENNCYDFLISTPLNTSVLLIGKLAPAIVLSVVLIIGVFPIMSACALLGGISSVELMAGNMTLLCAAVTFASIGCFLSSVFERTQAALAASYMVVLPVALGGAWFLYTSGLLSSIFMLPLLMLFTFLVASILLLSTHYVLRTPYEPAPPADRGLEREEAYSLYLSPHRFPDRFFIPHERHPGDTKRVNPFTDKELRSEIFGRGMRWARVAIQLSLFLSVILGFFYAPTSPYFGNTHHYFIFLLTYVILIGGSIASPGYSQERERRTLEMLLTTLVRLRHVIWSKYWVPMRVTLILTSFLFIPPLFSLAMGYIIPQLDTLSLVHLAANLALLLVAADLVVTSSNFFSAGATTTSLALVRAYAFLALFFAGPLLVRLGFVAVLGEAPAEIQYFSPFLAFLGDQSPDAPRGIPDTYLTNLAAVFGTSLLFKGMLWLRLRRFLARGIA